MMPGRNAMKHWLPDPEGIKAGRYRLGSSGDEWVQRLVIWIVSGLFFEKSEAGADELVHHGKEDGHFAFAGSFQAIGKGA